MSRSGHSFAKVSTALLSAILAAALFSQTAAAKGEMRATLDRPVPADATPGTQIPVAWKLEVKDYRTEKFVPFGAGEVFVRLIGANAKQSTEKVLEGNGAFSTSIVVPPGGIKRVEIGIKGMRESHGAPTQADYLIPIVGKTIATPPVAEHHGLASRWLALIAGMALFLVLLALIVRFRNSESRSTSGKAPASA